MWPKPVRWIGREWVVALRVLNLCDTSPEIVFSILRVPRLDMFLSVACLLQFHNMLPNPSAVDVFFSEPHVVVPPRNYGYVPLAVRAPSLPPRRLRPTVLPVRCSSAGVTDDAVRDVLERWTVPEEYLHDASSPESRQRTMCRTETANQLWVWYRWHSFNMTGMTSWARIG